mgnify:CR=1 FL=1
MAAEQSPSFMNPARHFRLGPLSFLFADGQLLYLRIGDVEVLRRIYFAVRDERWVTVPSAVFDEEIEVSEDAIQLRCLGVHESAEICFQWRAEISVARTPDGVNVKFSASGQPETDFLSNRIGLCVLHPIEGYRGRRATVVAVDGGRSEAVFPDDIAPHAPFSNVRELHYRIGPDEAYAVALKFSGDTFEAEDQRQWGDDSLKTYSRPQSLPKPFEILTGTTVAQMVEFDVKIPPAQTPVAFTDSFSVSVAVDANRTFRLPAIGFSLPFGSRSHTGRERQRLEQLKPSFFRLDLVPVRGSSSDEMAAAVEESRRFNVPLELAVWLSRAPQREMVRLIEVLDTYTPRMVGAVLLPLLDQVLSSDVRRAARQVLKHSIPEIPIGVAPHPYFAEANRHRDLAEKAGFLCVPTAPSSHLYDDRTLVENLPVPIALARTVRAHSPSMPLVLGRVDLRPQPQPGASLRGPEGRIASHVDARQASISLASWTAVHIGMVARAGFDRVTYFETTGPLGLMPSEQGPALPEGFGSPHACVFPVFHTFADVAELSSPVVLESTSSLPLEVGALVLRSQNRIRILLANFGDSERQVHFQGIPTQGNVFRMSPRNLAQAVGEPERFRGRTPVVHSGGPIVMAPHELVRFDILGA